MNPTGHSFCISLVAISILVIAATDSAQTTGVIPADRDASANWSNAGMMSKGGIPSRTTIYTNLAAGDGTTDDSARIQAALDSCPDGQVVTLSAGTFVINNYLLIHSPITLRGAGAGVTILRKSNGAEPRTTTLVAGTGVYTPVDPSTYTYDPQPIIIVGPSRWNNGPDDASSQNLTTDGIQGATSVTVANAGAFHAGQIVLLDELSGASWQAVPAGFGCTDSALSSPCPPLVWQGDRVAWNMHLPTQTYQDDNGNSDESGPYDTTPGTPPAAVSWFSRTDRPTTEIKEIGTVSGNTVTFASPLTIGYRVSHAAQLTLYDTDENGVIVASGDVHVSNAGVESLSMYGGADGSLRFEAAAYSWAKSVEVTQWIGEGVAVDNSFRIELRDSDIHTGSWPQPGGAGYAISLADGSAEVLVENNIMSDACKEIVDRSCGAGSVVAYNYADDSWDADAVTWVEVGLNASHMAGPHHVLFEGNYSQNFDSDYTHGNAIYLTAFRNWFSGKRLSFPDTNTNARAVGLAYGSWWDSFVGNVLGRAGQMNGWQYTDGAMSCDTNGNNCTGDNANWNFDAIWSLGYDPERWGMVPDPKVLSTVIRDGNYDYLTGSQHWHNTPGGFTIPDSLYLAGKPGFFGNCPWPWVDPATGAIFSLPAKARLDAGTPFTNTCGGTFVPPTLTAQAAPGGTLDITCASASGLTYQLEVNNHLGTTNWSPLGGAISGTGNPISFTVILGGTSQFFRVQILP